MSQFWRKCALCALVGCCLAAVAGGCRFQRTGRGFILRSQWQLECEDIPRLSFATAQQHEPEIEQPPAEPERLRWRIRRRGYELASRLFGRGDCSYQNNVHRLIKEEEAESQPSEDGGELRLAERPDLVVE